MFSHGVSWVAGQVLLALGLGDRHRAHHEP
jgi:hypothetical protein